MNQKNEILFYHPDLSGQFQVLGPDESRHCIKALRKKAGDLIRLTNGRGTFFDGIVADENPKKCTIEITGSQSLEQREPWKLHLAIAPTKNIGRFEWLLEKATEIGVDEITPLICENSERKILKTERLKKILVSAMKQSLKSFLPVLHEPIDYKSFVNEGHEYEKFIAYCSNNYRDQLKDRYKQGKDALILVGPEGDFSDSEIAMALEQGYHPVSLGSSRLRTETAGITACFTIGLANS